VDSNDSCFTCFSSGSSSPKVAEFVQLCAQSILSLRPKPPLACALSSIYSLPCDNFVKKVVPQMKKLSLFVTTFKDLYVSRVLF
jgi:hypothetical protein